MTIDKSGKWWKSNQPDDLHAYLTECSEKEYVIDECRPCKCKCGSMEFRLEGDQEEGAAQRTCAKCETRHFICDSGEYWEDAEPEKWKCVCSSSIANIGVGFAFYEEKSDVHWLYVGVRCAKCGVLGCFTEWKIGYGPSMQLLEQA